MPSSVVTLETVAVKPTPRIGNLLRIILLCANTQELAQHGMRRYGDPLIRGSLT